MKRQTFHLEIITPCFCGGADAAIAEIRAPSIRGQLRWWFRALGGSKDEESQIFGSVGRDDTGASSAIRVSISNLVRGPAWFPIQLDQNSPQNYVWHFAAASGRPANAGRGVSGPRWQEKGLIPPGSTFDMIITRMRTLPTALDEKLDIALDAFLAFGTIGLRATRGLGAFSCARVDTSWEQMVETLESVGFMVSLRDKEFIFTSWELALRDWSSWLRYKFRKEFKAERFSALGGIQPRQASAVRFRPIKLGTNKFTWVALEAPHKRILGQTTARILTSTILTGPAPTPPPARR